MKTLRDTFVFLCLRGYNAIPASELIVIMATSSKKRFFTPENPMDPSVKKKFNSYPDHIKPKMKELRGLIYEVADSTEEVGDIKETLKWGEPAYLTKNPKSGTTIRIDWKDKKADQLAMYVSCNTTLIDTFRSRFADKLAFEGNRAVVFPDDKPLPKKELMLCIQMALTYHLGKKR